MNLIERLKKPAHIAPLESWTVKLVSEGVNKHPYNIVTYGDLFWGVHWSEGAFDLDRFMEGEANAPILIGESADEVTCGLNLMYPESDNGGGASRPATLFFQNEIQNIYKLRDDKRLDVLAGAAESPALKNALAAKIDLFEPGHGQPITIISPAPSRSCFYRCEYCYHHDHGFNKNTAAMESWAKALLTAVERIQRPLRLSIGAMGEPLCNTQWLEVIDQVLDYDHVDLVAFVSNLPEEVDAFFGRVDGKRIGVLASIHPTQFKNHDEDLKLFLDRASLIKETGASIVVSQVLTPDALKTFETYRDHINARGIPTIGHILRGPYRGKQYPMAYTPEEIAKARNYGGECEFIYDYQSHLRSPYGGRCASGFSGFFMEYEGTVYNCHFARQLMGSIYDDSLMVRREPGYCTSKLCECQTTIGWREEVSDRFEMQRSLHHFHPRS